MASKNTLAWLKKLLAIFLGFYAYGYGYEVSHSIYVKFLGYEPFFMYWSMELANSFVGALLSASVCALVIWNKKLLVKYTLILAILVLIFEVISGLLASAWTDMGYSMRYIAIITGFILVPLVNIGIARLLNNVQHSDNVTHT